MRASASLSPAALRAMPHFSHMILPSSRWNESTVRFPLIAEQPRRSAPVTSASTRLNSGWSVSTGASFAVAR